MLIDCPACARSYHVSPTEIGPRGRTVICPRCETRWVVDANGAPRLKASQGELRATLRSGPAQSSPRLTARRRGPVFRPVLLIALGMIVAMAAIAGRTAIVRHVPRLAGLYAAAGLPVNVRGLEIEALSPQRPAQDTLIVSGTIHNIAGHRVGVPRLVYEVRDEAGATLLSWTEAAPTRALVTGARLAFSSRLHVVPPEGRSVLVHFADAEVHPKPLIPTRLN
jgi:predicted Zn finger-like uncharacterized protein